MGQGAGVWDGCQGALRLRGERGILFMNMLTLCKTDFKYKVLQWNHITALFQINLFQAPCFISGWLKHEDVLKSRQVKLYLRH